MSANLLVFDYDAKASLTKTYFEETRTFYELRQKWELNTKPAKLVKYRTPVAVVGYDNGNENPTNLQIIEETYCTFEEYVKPHNSQLRKRIHAILNDCVQDADENPSLEDFLSLNLTAAWTFAQSWMRLVNDVIGEAAARYLEATLANYSITRVVRDANGMADAVLSTTSLPLDNLFYNIQEYIDNNAVNRPNRTSMIQAMSYSKNFSLSKVPGYKAAALVAFALRQNKTRRSMMRLGRDSVKEEKLNIAALIWYKTLGQDPHFSKSTHDGKFYYGPGKTLPTSKSKDYPRDSAATKWLEVAAHFAPPSYCWDLLPDGLLLHDELPLNAVIKGCRFLRPTTVKAAIMDDDEVTYSSARGLVTGTSNTLQMEKDTIFEVGRFYYEPFSAPQRVLASATGVPKNYKTYRIITQMQTLDAHFGFKLFRENIQPLYKTVPLFKNCVHSDDQQLQREKLERYLKQGAATTDCSAASDCHSMALLKRIATPKWYDAVASVRPTHFYVMNQLIQSYCVGPMGAGCTFDVMQLVLLFLALANSFVEDQLNGKLLYSSLSDFLEHVLSDEGDGLTRIVGVVGDDIISPAVHVRAYWDLLTYVGMEVNEEKSFANGVDAESCGIYMIDSLPTTIQRFPRSFEGVRIKPVTTPTAENSAGLVNAASLVSLQHRLWSLSPSNRDFLASLVDNSLGNRMPCRAPVGSDIACCWADIATPLVEQKLPDGNVVPIMAPVGGNYTPADSQYDEPVGFMVRRADAARRDGYWYVTEVPKQYVTATGKAIFSDKQIAFVERKFAYTDFIRNGPIPIREMMTYDEGSFLLVHFGKMVDGVFTVVLPEGVDEEGLSTMSLVLPTEKAVARTSLKRLGGYLTSQCCGGKATWSMLMT